MLAKASNCPRRKFGAMLLDPERNVVLMDGYNGGPRGGGELCGGHWCVRDGLKPEDVDVRLEVADPKGPTRWRRIWLKGQCLPERHALAVDAEDAKRRILEAYPPIKSGTCMERGCHHAEMNVVANCAAAGVASKGAWLFVTGEPCLLCAKLIHHAGIAHVVVISEGYLGENGLPYLKRHGVKVTQVSGPKDPRLPQARSGGSTSSSP